MRSCTGTHAWGLQFGYDVWANLLSASVTQGSAPTLSVGADQNNRIAGYCYDAAGNLLIEASCGGTVTYTYDAENRITITGGVTYTYDGDGKRVKKSSGKLYWGELAESDLAGTISDEYIFFGSKRIARRIVSSGVVHYYFADHLGSSRIVTNASGAILEDSDFYPFGGERVVVDSADNRYKFTGKERDTESGLDYFGARYYASLSGRFASADSLLQSKLRLINPQGWNAYAYVLNNPMKMVDPDGKEAKIVIVNNSSYGPKVVNSAASQLQSFAKESGLKNVSVTVVSSAAGATLKSTVDKHTVIVNVGDSSVSTLGEMGLRNPFGNVPGQANAVNVSKNAIEGAARPDGDPASQLGNVMKHEFVHTSQEVTGGHSQEPGNLMRDGYNPDYGGTLNEAQKQKLQNQYNRPNELDKDKPDQKKLQEEKKTP